jgi:hypothetical protein
LFAFVAVLSVSGAASAQELSVPQVLKSWEPWVMYGEEYRRCPLRNGVAPEDSSGFECRWPGRLRLSVASGGGEFAQRWRLYAEDWITLPGDETHWPENVAVDGAPAAVVAYEGAPRIRLGRGAHEVRGKFNWSRRPESLRIAPATALVDLTIDGKRIAPVELRDDRLWLGAVRTVAQPRALQVQVYRLLQDGSPMQLTTQLHLKVSGDAREELLARALPEGFAPLATSGELPFRFEPDGRLRIQVRSGEHIVTIQARAATVAERFVLPSGDGAWASEEIWSYRTDDRLRITAIEGAQPIDPMQAGVPLVWRDAPTYRVPRGGAIAIDERSRGLNREDANRLSLHRDLWLAFDHGGFDAVDQVTGTMQQGWRLDMLSPYRLLNARIDDETMLITDGADGRTGVEVRTPNLEVTALSRLEPNGALPATGWDARFENVAATLHLPPGHQLLAAWGVDDAPDAWLERWQLLDLFLLLLVTAAAYTLLGWGGAAAAGVAVLLTHHEAGAPSWFWINALIAIAIARAVPEGRLRKWAAAYRTTSLGVLILVLTPFAIAQYRLALHPQLQVETRQPQFGLAAGNVERPFGLTGDLRESAPSLMSSEAVSPPAFTPPAVRMEAPAVAMDAIVEPKQLDRYAPDAMLQTGPGTPNWQFLTYRLNWSGPVDPAQTVRLTIVSPFWLSLWRVLGIVLSALLVLALIRLSYGAPKTWTLPNPRGGSAVAASGLLAALVCLAPSSHAQTPDAQVLGELKRRLSEPARCAPNCAEIVVAGVDVNDDRLAIDLDVHAQANVALGMPHAGSAWIIERVLVDADPSDALSRRGDALELALTPGVHHISMVGRIAAADELSVEFPAPPRRVVVRTQGWDSSGSSEGRLLNNALQLTRRIGANASSATLTPQRLPAFVRIHRRVFMNLDWTVTTQVERLAPEEGAFTLRLPLLPGEAVLTPGFEVRDGYVLASMPAGVNVATWESSLERVDRLRWSAATDQPWVEQWDVIVSPTWHAGFSGTPAILPSEYLAGMWIHQFLPRPGESVDIAIVRPAASAGTTLAVDRVGVHSSFGRRLTNTMFEFGYRSSRGGRHEIRIPEDARLQALTFDGHPVSLQPDDGVLPLTLTPGVHTVALAFTRDSGAGVVSRPPQIDLGADGANVRTTMALARDRWVLFAWGDGVGPAILYWGELALFVILAVLLGRVGQTPLRTRDWLFLGLGLSTFSWWVLLVFGAWVFVLARRSQWNVQSATRFNLLQIALGVLSIAALVIVVSAIPYGLLGEPNMGIRGEGLTWFVDRSGAQLTQPTVISVSIWFYKLAMLLWALWLSFALLRWLPWAWRQFSTHGLWKGKVIAPA